MDENTVTQTALDLLVSDENSQFLKAVIPYLPDQQQQFFSILIKTRELSNTIALFSTRPGQLHAQSSKIADNPLDVLKEIGHYCYGENRNRIEQAVQLLTMIQLSQVLNETEI